MSDEKKTEKSEQPLKFRKIGDTSSKPAGGLAASLGKQEGMKMDKSKKRDDKITDLNLQKQPKIQSLWDLEGIVGKTHPAGTRTIQVNNIVDYRKVFDGEEIKKFRGKLQDVIQTRIASTSSTKLEVRLYLKRLVSNYCGRTSLAGYDGKDSGALCQTRGFIPSVLSFYPVNPAWITSALVSPYFI